MRRYASLLFLLTVPTPALTAGPTQSSGTSADSHLARGEMLHRTFDYAEAAREFEEAHRLAPERFEPLEWLCHVYNDLGDNASGKGGEAFYREAANYAETLRELFPQRAQGHFWVGASYGNLALFKGGKEKVRLARDVESAAKKAIELDPGFAPPYVVLGIYYREVAELNWFLRAFARMLYGEVPKGTREDSEKALRVAVKLDPANVFHHYQLGLTLLSLGRDADAAEQFRALLALPVTEARDRVNQADAKDRLAKMKSK